jgi:hypothetical protein
MSRLCTLSLALALLASTASAADKAPTAKPTVDVVLCLDVSSSMNGLIDSAKLKLWDIVNELGKAKPTPDLRVGLYSFGHSTYSAQNGWVRKEADLTTDLDTVYKKLNALTINGGQEYVARVTRDAVVEQKWSTDKKALKLIFVAGNEPATQDPMVTLPQVAKLAIEKDIIVNTIYCGSAASAEARGWSDFAKSAEGRYVSIDQNRAVATVVNTPHDAKLSQLSGELNKTYVSYGRADVRKDKAENQKAQDANASRSSPSAGASRATSKAGGLYRNADWDLVDRITDDPKFDITKIPEDQLCDELKKLKPEERVKYVQEQLNKRRSIQKEIGELSQKRTEFIQAEIKKNAGKGEKALDEAIRETIRNQANTKGINIPD